MLAPGASVAPFVEVPQEENKANKGGDQPSCPENPPRPPERLAALEEGHWLLGELRQADDRAL